MQYFPRMQRCTFVNFFSLEIQILGKNVKIRKPRFSFLRDSYFTDISSTETRFFVQIIMFLTRLKFSNDWSKPIFLSCRSKFWRLLASDHIYNYTLVDMKPRMHENRKKMLFSTFLYAWREGRGAFREYLLRVQPPEMGLVVHIFIKNYGK